ncbi:hypothetical protein IJG14_06870 [bacterium]|nr:hypothetical protein [bacterium]
MRKDNMFENYSETIFYQISLTARYQKLLILDYFSQIGLDMNPDEFLALDIISINPGICQRDLAKEILKDRAGTGRILLSLEAKGLVERFVTTKGNRLVRSMKLTETGEKALKKAQEKLMPSILKMKELFPQEDVDELKKMLNKIRSVLSEHVQTNI